MNGRAALAAAAALIAAVYLRGYRVVFKNGVVLALSPQMARILPVVDRVYRRVAGIEAVVTSANDGKHKAGSLHYSGNAIDLRTNNTTRDFELRDELRSELDKEFGRGLYDVVYESRLTKVENGRTVIVREEHIHVEYDPR